MFCWNNFNEFMLYHEHSMILKGECHFKITLNCAPTVFQTLQDIKNLSILVKSSFVPYLCELDNGTLFNGT